MIWLIYALISAFSDGIKQIIHRHVMKTESPFAYALLESTLTALIFLPILYREFVLPAGIKPYLILAASSILWTLIPITGFQAYKTTHVSIKTPISQSRLIFVLILSAIFLGEVIFLEKIIGTLLIFLSIIILTFKRGKISFDRGIQLTLLSSLLFAFVTITDKKAMDYFTPGMFGFLVYLIPGLILLLFVKKRTKETKNLIVKKWPFVLSILVLGAVLYYFKLKAFTLADASLVFPIIRSSTFVAAIGGMLIYKEERKEIGKKIIALIIMLAGAILISGIYSIF